MNVGRDRTGRSIRFLLRRKMNAGESERQTVYTLLLAFVPFAAIVGAMAANSNAQMVESLARRLRDVDSAMDVIRDLAGVNEQVGPEALVAQARWAFKNKEKIEVHYVQTVKEESLCWAEADQAGHDISFAEESAQVRQLAGLTGEERRASVTRSILSYVAGQLEGLTVQDLSKRTREEAAAMAATIVAKKEEALYRTYVDQALADKRLHQMHVHLRNKNPASREQIETSPEAEAEIDGWVAAGKVGFRDCPPSAPSIEKDAAAQFRATQLQALWDAFEQARPKIAQATSTCPLSPSDYLPANATAACDRVCAEIMEKVVKSVEPGPLPEWAARRRAEEVLGQRKGAMEKTLLAAVPKTLDPSMAARLKGVVRTNREEVRSEIEAYALVQCQLAVGATTSLDKAELGAFPSVWKAVTAQVSKLTEETTVAVSQEIQGNIRRLAKSPQELDKLLKEAPKNTLAEAANLTAKGQQITTKAFPSLQPVVDKGKEAVAGGLPLSEKETDQVQEIVAAHVKLRAGELQDAGVRTVTGVTQVAVLAKTTDLKAFRTPAGLIGEVEQVILNAAPGAGSLDAVRQKAHEQARQLVEARREELVELLVGYMSTSLSKKMQSMKTAPLSAAERARSAETLLKQEFPVNTQVGTQKVTAGQEDLDAASKSKLLAGVLEPMKGMAVTRAIQETTAPAGFNPFPAGAQEVLRAALEKSVAATTGEKISEADRALISRQVIRICDDCATALQIRQLEAIKRLSDADLSAAIVGGPGDEKRAFETLQSLVLKQLTHPQLGPQAQERLKSVIQTLVQGRHQRTVQAQLDQINAFAADKLPESVTRRIAKGEQSNAVTEVQEAVARAVASQTKTPQVLDEALAALQKKAAALVDQRRKQIGEAQRQAIQALTVAELRGSVIALIVASGGDESKAVAAAQKDLDAVVRKQTGTSEAPCVLPEVLGDLTAKVKTLVHAQRERVAAAQVAAVKALTLAELPDTVIPAIASAEGNIAQAAKEVQKSLDLLIRERTNTADSTSLLSEASTALKERTLQLVSAKHDEELGRQRALVEGSIGSYKIQVKGGQTLEQFVEACVDEICKEAGILKDRRLPGTREFVRNRIAGEAKKAFDRMATLQQDVTDLLRDAGGNVNLKPPITPKASQKAGGKTSLKTPVADPNPASNPIPVIPANFAGMTPEELEKARDWLVPIVERKKVVESARRLMREEMVWKPEWFRSYSFSLPFEAVEGVLSLLKSKGFASADTYRKEIGDDVQSEFTRIGQWCETEARKLVDSEQGRSSLDAEVAPYLAGEKDFSAWYPNKSVLVDDKMTAEAAARVTKRLVSGSTPSGTKSTPPQTKLTPSGTKRK